MRKTNPILRTDFYKIGHPFQYPENTTLVYSNMTPRKSRISGVNHMVFFGLQYFIKDFLMGDLQEFFFERPLSHLINDYKRMMKHTIGELKYYDHIEELHSLGFLPIRIKALPEGTLVPMRIPCLTIVNTHPSCYWLTNFLETVMSTYLWSPSQSATTAFEYKKILQHYAKVSGGDLDFVNWQGHDFSMRGMSSWQTAATNGAGHLLSFYGTDTIPAIEFVEEFYGGNIENELIGGSVAATEHAVMCAGSKDGEFDTFKRLITDIYPAGIVSIVSDTWDLFQVLTDFLPRLKSEILNRDGKVVIRPDSGNPLHIICGKPEKEYDQASGTWKTLNITDSERKGVFQLLWDVFGGTINEKGLKVLSPKIGAIYGEAITLQMADDICRKLLENGFVPNIVFGIGSYTYQYVTRDTMGQAIKATYVEVDGIGRNIFKNPKTDDGTKASACGLLQVYKNEFGELCLKDQCIWQEEEKGLLKVVYENGHLIKNESFQSIRNRLNAYLTH